MRNKTKRKPAIWTTLRAGKAQLTKAAKVKAAKLAQKAVAKRIDPRKRIAVMSERMKARNAEYRKVRDDWMILPDGTRRTCSACLKIQYPANVRPMEFLHDATEPHHSRGKLGSLLCDTRFWIPVCRAAHTWIDANREKARELGLLCKRGEWNKQPKD